MPTIYLPELSECICGSHAKIHWGEKRSPAKVRCTNNKCRRRSAKFSLSNTCVSDAIADWNKKMETLRADSAAGRKEK